MSNDLLISAYQNQTAKISDIKKRHWLFLLALAGIHTYASHHKETDISPLAYAVVVFFLGALMWHGSNTLNFVRLKLLKFYEEMRERDSTLKKLLNFDVTKQDLGDHMMHFSGIYAPLLSVGLLWPEYLPQLVIAAYGAAFYDLCALGKRPGNTEELEAIYLLPFVFISIFTTFLLH